MNRAEGGGWEFLDYLKPPLKGFTWNGAAGCDIQDCAVRQRRACYAEKQVKRLGHICELCPTFEPHVHEDRLYEPIRRKKPSVIVPVSTGDLFGQPLKTIHRIIDVIEEAHWHTFPILTKAPQNAGIFRFPHNVWFGVTVNDKFDVWRLNELRGILERQDYAIHGWAVFEPLYSEIDRDLTWLKWIIIGPQTRPDLQPEDEWVQTILDNAEGVPVFMKSNLEFSPIRRESPQGLTFEVRK